MFYLIPLCILAAALFLHAENNERYLAAVCLKGLASLCFVLLGISLAGPSVTARQIVIGTILGMIADIFLNLRYLFKNKGRLVFLAGILIFLSGHIMYLLAIIPLAGNRLICLICALIATVFLMKWLFERISAEKAFKIFGVVYIGAIVALNFLAAGALLKQPSAFTSIFFGGALLFLVSDIVLILNTFTKESKLSLRITNIGLYYLGQLLIAVSLHFLK